MSNKDPFPQPTYPFAPGVIDTGRAPADLAPDPFCLLLTEIIVLLLLACSFGTLFALAITWGWAA